MIINGSFEIAGTLPGEADSWAFTSIASIAEYAEFNFGSYNVAFEGFEKAWNNDAFKWFFVPLDIASPVWDGPPIEAETFEARWSSNETWSDVLVSTDPALFNTTLDQFEAFEREWLSNEGYIWSLGPTSMAQFNSTLNNYEGFEREWRSNQSYMWSLGATSTAVFDVAVPVAYEQFLWTEWPTVRMVTI